jgi:hypothetical protein
MNTTCKLLKDDGLGATDQQIFIKQVWLQRTYPAVGRQAASPQESSRPSQSRV